MVNRWLLEDDDDTKVFYRNPVSMTSPHPQKEVVADPTSNPHNGSAPVIKAPTVVQEWTWSGNVYSDAERLALLAWHEKDTAFFVTDHLLRTWKVLSARLEIAERKPSASNPTRYTYEWTVINLGLVGP